MTILFLILPTTLLLSLGAALAFAWATRSGQFDDLETPALRALDDEVSREKTEADRSCPNANRA